MNEFTLLTRASETYVCLSKYYSLYSYSRINVPFKTEPGHLNLTLDESACESFLCFSMGFQEASTSWHPFEDYLGQSKLLLRSLCSETTFYSFLLARPVELLCGIP